MTHRLYVKDTYSQMSSVTLSPDDSGTLRSVSADGSLELSEPLSFPQILHFTGSDVVEIRDRDHLDRVLTQKGYSRFEMNETYSSPPQNER